jgi:hypothetical protein
LLFFLSFLSFLDFFAMTVLPSRRRRDGVDRPRAPRHRKSCVQRHATEGFTASDLAETLATEVRGCQEVGGVHNPSSHIAQQLAKAGVPPQRLHDPRPAEGTSAVT